MRNTLSFFVAFYNIGIWFIPIEDALRGISVFLSTVYIALKIYQEFIASKKSVKE